MDVFKGTLQCQLVYDLGILQINIVQLDDIFFSFVSLDMTNQITICTHTWNNIIT